MGLPDVKWCPEWCKEWREIKELEKRLDGPGDSRVIPL